MDALIGCDHIPWILHIPFNSLFYWTSISWTTIVIPVHVHMIHISTFFLTKTHPNLLWLKNDININLYLGFGLFFTIFFPYFLHLNPSSRISICDFVLKATFFFVSFWVCPILLPPTNNLKKTYSWLNIY